jgi:hypothetical protein
MSRSQQQQKNEAMRNEERRCGESWNEKRRAKPPWLAIVVPYSLKHGVHEIDSTPEIENPGDDDCTWRASVQH